MILVGVAVAIAVIASVLIVLGANRQSHPSSGGLPGLRETQAPWSAHSSGLATRISTLQIPPPGSEKFHIHARLAVVIEGKQTPVPTDIGIEPPTASALHTHDDSGVIHVESAAPFNDTIGDFFAIWGVKFSKDQIGAYKNDATKTVQVYVNGQKVDNPESYVMKAHDKIVVAYGAVGSFPTTISQEFPPGE